MLSVINNERPLYPGNYTRMIKEFDTCVRCCLCLPFTELAYGCRAETATGGSP